jgi:hypothetical protein
MPTMFMGFAHFFLHVSNCRTHGQIPYKFLEQIEQKQRVAKHSIALSKDLNTQLRRSSSIFSAYFYTQSRAPSLRQSAEFAEKT